MSDETVDTGAGAVTPESTPAAVTSETTTPAPEQSAGAVTPESQPSAVEGEEATGTDQTNGQETAGGQRKLTFEERVAEVASKQVAEVEARLTAQLKDVTQTKAPLDFIPDIDMGKVNTFIQEKLTEIEQAQLDGDFVKALDLQEELRTTREQIRANESRKAAYMEQQQATMATEQQTAALNAKINDAMVLVAKEFNIPDEVWKQGQAFFDAERRAKPLLNAQYEEKVLLQGPVNALIWAKEYIEQNMGKKEQDLINSKEAAKETLPAGKTATGVVTDEKATALVKAKEAAQSGNPSDLAAYSKLLRESRQ